MPFSDRALRSLGEYVVAYSRVEGMLAALIAVLLDSRAPYAAGMMTSIAPSRRLVEVARALTQDAELAPILARVATAEAERNTFLHSTWLDNMADGSDDNLRRWKLRVPKSASNQTRGVLGRVPAAYLERRSAELQALAQELHDAGARVAATRGQMWPPMP